MRTLCLLFILIAAAYPAAIADELTLKELTTARNIYVGKWAKSHRFYEPTNYSEKDWRTWMEKMNKKSKLKEDQASLLTRYLDAYRAGHLPGTPQDKPKSTFWKSPAKTVSESSHLHFNPLMPATLTTCKLAGQPVGQRIRIKGFSLPEGVRLRLLEMGLTEGIECRVVRYVPLGDTMEVQVRGYFLSLRAAEAEGVLIEIVD
jgi:ferrous iron transport protein A